MEYSPAPRDIKITPAMIEAGRKQLHESGMLPLGTEGQSYETAVIKAIFLAMIAEATMK